MSGPCPKCGSNRWAAWGEEGEIHCMECERRRSAARRRARPQVTLYGATVRRAREAGLPHSLTQADVDEIVAPWTCEYCQTPVGSFAGGQRPNSATLDRLIPDAGYTRENTVLACHRCNCMKSEHTPTSLRQWAMRIELLILNRQNLKANA